MNLSMQPPSIRIEVDHMEPNKGKVFCHGIEVKLSPINFVFYTLLAKRSAEGQTLDTLEETDYKTIKSLGKDPHEKEKISKETIDHTDIKKFFDDRRNDIKKAMLKALDAIGEQYCVNAENHQSSLSIKNIVINGTMFENA